MGYPEPFLAYVQNARVPALGGVRLYLTVWQRISAQSRTFILRLEETAFQINRFFEAGEKNEPIAELYGAVKEAKKLRFNVSGPR
jgi:hypothetical protein